MIEVTTNFRGNVPLWTGYRSHLELLTAYLEMCERVGIKRNESDIKPLRISRKTATCYALILEAYSPNESIQTIAQKAGMGIDTVRKNLSRLVDSGWLPSRQHQLLTTIRPLHLEGKRYGEIAVIVGCSPSIVGRVVRKEIGVIGTPLSEVVRRLHRSSDTIKNAIVSEEIACLHYNKLHLTDEGIERLVTKLQCAEKLCGVCGKPFQSKTKSSTVCSVRCKEKRRHDHDIETRYKAKPDSTKLRGWVRELWTAIHSRPMATTDQWVEYSEALKISGLSQMRLRHLMQRCIIHSREHPSKKWATSGNRQPVRVCLASEVKLAGEIYQQFKAKS